MSGLLDSITGATAKKAQAMQMAAAEASQNQSLAALAREQATIDQAGSSTSGPRGRRLLTFIGAGGADKMA